MISLLEQTISSISATLDEDAFFAAQERLANQAKPAGSLGVMEDISVRLAAIKGTIDVNLANKHIITCAGDHGVTQEGVSLFPSKVTQQMVYNFANNGASVNVIGKHANATVQAADLGVDHDFEPDLPIIHKKIRRGTANFTKEPAMTRQEAISSIEAGHSFMHERLGLEPLIDLKFRLGEGTGAAVCMELLDLSTRILADIKTFEEVGINNAQ